MMKAARAAAPSSISSGEDRSESTRWEIANASLGDVALPQAACPRVGGQAVVAAAAAGAAVAAAVVAEESVTATLAAVLAVAMEMAIMARSEAGFV